MRKNGFLSSFRPVSRDDNQCARLTCFSSRPPFLAGQLGFFPLYLAVSFFEQAWRVVRASVSECGGCHGRMDLKVFPEGRQGPYGRANAAAGSETPQRRSLQCHTCNLQLMLPPFGEIAAFDHICPLCNFQVCEEVLWLLPIPSRDPGSKPRHRRTEIMDGGMRSCTGPFLFFLDACRP